MRICEASILISVTAVFQFLYNLADRRHKAELGDAARTAEVR